MIETESDFTDYLLEDTDYVEQVMELEDMERQNVLEIVEMLEENPRMREIIIDAKYEDLKLLDLWEDPSSTRTIKMLQSSGLAEFPGTEHELRTTWASRLYVECLEDYRLL